MNLFAFLIIYVFLTFILKSILFWKKTGINPITFKGKDDAYGFAEKMFVILSTFTIIVVFIHDFLYSWYIYLLPFWYLEKSVLVYLGWLMLFGSLILIIIAQKQMSDSWRIGIDKERQFELIQQGLYKYSRNPIYIGLIFFMVGLFLVIPNAFILLTCVVSIVCIHFQVRLEEAFLTKVFPDQYSIYSKKVGRWCSISLNLSFGHT